MPYNHVSHSDLITLFGSIKKYTSFQDFKFEMPKQKTSNKTINKFKDLVEILSTDELIINYVHRFIDRIESSITLNPSIDFYKQLEKRVSPFCNAPVQKLKGHITDNLVLNKNNLYLLCDIKSVITNDGYENKDFRKCSPKFRSFVLDCKMPRIGPLSLDLSGVNYIDPDIRLNVPRIIGSI